MCNAQIILVLSRSHFLPNKLIKMLASLRILEILVFSDIWIQEKKQKQTKTPKSPAKNHQGERNVEKEPKPQLRIIEREMWKYDLKDSVYDSEEGGEEGHETMINAPEPSLLYHPQVNFWVKKKTRQEHVWNILYFSEGKMSLE